MASKPKSKRKIAPEAVISPTGIELTEVYCLKCMKMKKPMDFYKTLDNGYLFANGYIPCCKECVSTFYNNLYNSEQSVDRTMLRMCRMLNVKYSVPALNALHKHLETLAGKGKTTNNTFGMYLTKLVSTTPTKISDKGNVRDITDFTFHEPITDELPIDFDTKIDDRGYLEKLWGTNLTQDDYDYLEDEYLNWVGPIGNVTHSEEVLIREMCHIQNLIRRARLENSVSKIPALVEDLQKIMKNSALTPALQKAASAGRNADCWGTWMRDIENYRPAEWYEKEYKNKYRDMEGIKEDVEDIKRSMGNFITESKNFNTTELEGIMEIDEGE